MLRMDTAYPAAPRTRFDSTDALPASPVISMAAPRYPAPAPADSIAFERTARPVAADALEKTAAPHAPSNELDSIATLPPSPCLPGAAAHVPSDTCMAADPGAEGPRPAGHRVPLNAMPSTATMPDGGTSTSMREDGPSMADPGGSAASLTGLSRTSETLSYLPGATRAVPPSGVAATRDSSTDGRSAGGVAASPMAVTEPLRPTAYRVPAAEASMSTISPIPTEPISMSARMSYARMPPEPAAYSMPLPPEAV